MFRLPFLTLLFALCTPAARAQPTVHGRVLDGATGLPFAALRWVGTQAGTVADLDGYFSIALPATTDTTAPLRLRAVASGFLADEVNVRRGDSIFITLVPRPGSGNVIGEVVVRPRFDKVRRLMRLAIAARSTHDPARYPFYRCNVYYKLVADADFSGLALDAEDSAEIHAFTETKHLLVAETFSRRTGRRYDQVQEDVLATRFSGAPATGVASLVTGILPFSASTDYLTLNGRDYPNPVAAGWESRYAINLSEELAEGTDTLWVLSFWPRRDPEGLRGTLTIHSAGYAVSRLRAESRDTTIGRILRIEQQYERGPGGRWFPRALNYVFDWKVSTAGTTLPVIMTGISRIDSVSFDEAPSLRIDKAHTVRLEPGAETTPEAVWEGLRGGTLTAREARTYVYTDSLMEEMGMGKILRNADRLADGRVPIGPFELDLKRIYAYNPYERSRWGFGWQTGKAISNRVSVGAWAGYGVGDKRWKWGAFAEWNPGRYRETLLRIGIEDDIRDPGRVSLHREIDKPFLRQWLLQRADRVEAAFATLRLRTGYLTTEVGARAERITPLWDYRFLSESWPNMQFQATEASLAFRYAFGERTAPSFGRYFSTGTRYPIAYARLTGGELSAPDYAYRTPYVQALAALSYTVHVNRLGREQLMVIAGQSWSDEPLPLSKLFAGRGYRAENNAVYVSGGLLTMRPYEYYSDRFVSLHLRHDFDWKFFRTKYSQPSLGLAYNGLVGTLENRGLHFGAPFSVPARPYHEAGIFLNDLVRLKYLGMGWISLHVGYFYHLQPGDFNHEQNGAVVYGIGFQI